MRAVTFIAVSALVALSTLSIATQFIAQTFAFQPVLGRPIMSFDGVRFYAPWSILPWTERWAEQYPKPFVVARIVVIAGFAIAIGIALASLRKPVALGDFCKRAWAKFADVAAAGLFAKQGVVLGKFDGEVMAFDGPEHQLLIGASRSGKGRGHVVPTLLSWPDSALVLDVKGELDRGDPRQGFPGTSGFRAEFGHVLRFAPTDPRSNSFNPLFEVRKGENEVRDAQNIAEIIVGPAEKSGAEHFWNSSAKIVITGLILHVLYAEPLQNKTLAIVRERLRDLDRTANEMRRTQHRLSPRTGAPEVHPEVLHAATSYLAGEERLRSGVKATAESFFGVFADPMVQEKTASSDFRLGDLMSAEKPVTLFLQPPPSDAQRLMPLMRLLINQAARSLMEDQICDGDGRSKKHRLLMLLDEFPQLGRLDYFERMMGAMAGYGLKAYLVCQSLNHITKTYSRENVIVDNCGIVTSFAAADPETATRIAEMAGEVWEIRPSVSEQRPRSVLGPGKGQITYREERRPLLLAADVRKLPRDEQLIFVSGLKPLRAKKIRFDAERLFAKRLRPPAALSPPISRTHDWADVAPIIRAPAPRKPLSAGRGARAGVSRTASAPGNQEDLFAGSSPAADGPASAAGPTRAESASTPEAQPGAGYGEKHEESEQPALVRRRRTSGV